MSRGRDRKLDAFVSVDELATMLNLDASTVAAIIADRSWPTFTLSRGERVIHRTLVATWVQQRLRSVDNWCRMPVRDLAEHYP